MYIYTWYKYIGHPSSLGLRKKNTVLRQSLDEISRALFDRPQKVHESWVSSTGQTKTLEGPVNPSDRWWRVTILNHVACDLLMFSIANSFRFPSMQGVGSGPSTSHTRESTLHAMLTEMARCQRWTAFVFSIFSHALAPFSCRLKGTIHLNGSAIRLSCERVRFGLPQGVDGVQRNHYPAVMAQKFCTHKGLVA